MNAPPGRYGVIYPDPPWQTITWSGKGRDRCPDGERLLASGNGYPTMTLEALKALPVASWAARDCRLFLWAVDSHLPQALELGAAWGFTFSTIAFVWAKQTRTGKSWQFGGGRSTGRAPRAACCSCGASSIGDRRPYGS